MAVCASSDVTHKALASQIEGVLKRIDLIKEKRENERMKNIEFELNVIELNESVNALKEEVESERHSNFLKLSKKQQTIKAKQELEAESLKNCVAEFPPEQIVQNNLVCRQVEFYFSDYNLKRDKRLLEKICKEPQRGYLSVSEVLSLSRVRQLVNSPNALYESLKNSHFIDMILEKEEKGKKTEDHTEDNKEKENEKENEREKTEIVFKPLFVGRIGFKAPTEKQFPFRRSVYIYGLSLSATKEDVLSMLSAFGGVTKVKMDFGCDSLDRQIQRQMLAKHRCYKLLSKDSAAMTMEFNAAHSSKDEEYSCYWCAKNKACADGYYHPKRIPGTPPAYRVCLQCAAAKAEEQCAKYDARSKLLKNDEALRDLLLGLPPRPANECKTALCVFASQRQASKCVYVRSRLAINGAFATHYHHYSKLKKEIALNSKPKNLKIIKSKNTKPDILKTVTAPVYEGKERAPVIQPHA